MPSLPINVNTAGDNAIIAGVPGYAIRVITFHLTAAGAVAVSFKSGIGGGAVALGGPYNFSAGGVVNAPDLGTNARGHFQTASGQALNLNLGTSVVVSGHIVYELAPQ